MFLIIWNNFKINEPLLIHRILIKNLSVRAEQINNNH